MSDPKRATLITVGAPKSANTNVNKTVRLTVNLDESNESKYPELNYKELLITTARKKRVENGKKTGLDPFSDNDDDVERVARKFEQKYGGNSTYGRKGRSKYEDFADIGAGYDENDSFIDNTHGYDEMIPPECDTLYGGFYINCGSLEFKTVSENQTASDGEPNRRNKRQISSSSSEEESSESSSESDSQEAKDPKAIANGEVDSHKTEHRKKKNKTIDKPKAKKVRRTDSSAATSGKQTSDENVHGDAESADSRTSQSDSLTSKPAPSSENAVTSDSSRDVEAKAELKLPSPVRELLEELDTLVRRARDDPGHDSAKADHCVVRLHQSLDRSGADGAMRRVAWHRAALAMNTSRAKLLQMVKTWKTERGADCDAASAPTETAQPPAPVSSTNTTNTSTSTSHKRKAEDFVERLDVSRLTPDEKEAKIAETIQRLAELIAERRPGMIAAYNAECERVQEKRKKLKLESATEGAPFVDKRLPKRRFPWCPRARALLTRLAALAGDPESAANLLATRVLKLFPAGFVRMPTLLRQADLSKEIKASDIKRPRLGSQSASQSVITSTQQLNEQIQFPSSLTVTTTSVKNIDEDKDKYKVNPAAVFGTVINSYSLSQDLVKEKDDKKKDSEQCKDDLYNPPSNIGSITITAVPPSQKDKKTSNVNDKPKDTPLIRVKSPAALNEMVANKKEKEKDKYKKTDKDKEHNSKRFDNPLHVESTKHNLKKFDTPLHVDSHNLKKFDTPMLVDTTKNSKRIDTPMLVDTTKNLKRIDTPMLVDTTKNSKRIDTPMLVDTTKNTKRIDTPMLVDTIKNSKRLDTPLHVDTTNHNKKEPEKSPNQKTKEEFSKKQIESMKVAESNIPRPGLVSVSHSPTFAKPDKRPPEVKKKKDILIVSDVDPLGDIIQEPVSVDDDSSDVELVEEKFVDKSEPKSENIVPLKDRSDKSDSHKRVKNNVKVKSGSEKSASGKDCSVRKKTDEPTKEDFDSVMRDLSEMKNSQEPTTLNCNSFGVITNAKHESSKHTYSRPAVIGEPRTDKNKFAERTSLKKMDGYSEVTG